MLIENICSLTDFTTYHHTNYGAAFKNMAPKQIEDTKFRMSTSLANIFFLFHLLIF